MSSDSPSKCLRLLCLQTGFKDFKPTKFESDKAKGSNLIKKTRPHVYFCFIFYFFHCKNANFLTKLHIAELSTIMFHVVRRNYAKRCKGVEREWGSLTLFCCRQLRNFFFRWNHLPEKIFQTRLKSLQCFIFSLFMNTDVYHRNQLCTNFSRKS